MLLRNYKTSDSPVYDDEDILYFNSEHSTALNYHCFVKKFILNLTKEFKILSCYNYIEN